jgi:hypothetical protein
LTPGGIERDRRRAAEDADVRAALTGQGSTDSRLPSA